MENCFSQLRAPVKRIGLPAVPIPCSLKLEHMILPGAHDIVGHSLELLKLVTIN
jgi:pyruvate/2-oxoglutarate/acetoin dehydrogenase E1 component